MTSIMTCTKFLCLVILLSLLNTVLCVELTFEPAVLSFKLGANVSFIAILKNANSTIYQIPITVDMDEIILSSSKLEFKIKAWENSSEDEMWLMSRKCGVAIISPNSSDTELNRNFIRVTVFRYEELELVVIVVGWIYFTCWMLAAYPQVITNYQRKSVVGFSLDFLALNFIGHFSYMIFNCGLYWIPIVKDIYFAEHPHGVNPVQLNDVLFSVHSVFATAILIFQCFIYERGGQKISTLARIILLLITIGIIVCFVLTQVDIMTYLDYLLFFSYIKLGITFVKQIPQVYINYSRQSTVGFNIGSSILDIIGGLMSVGQMLLICYNFDDWGSLIDGDISKLGLGTLSMAFDLVFMFQHYVLYRHQPPVKVKSGSIPYKAFGGPAFYIN